VLTLSTVRPGTSGGMSMEGTAAGIAASFILALVGVAVGLITAPFVWCVVAGAFVGSLVESVLSSKLEAAGILNNDALNFINTLVGAAFAVLIGQAAFPS
jgi:uncharacterized protein (TIGR00297 family)